MGYLEKESGKRARRANIKKVILGSVAAAGVISVAVLAPNVLGALGKLGFLPNKRQKEIIRASRERLVRQGLLRWEDNKLRLTPTGTAALRKLELADYKLQKPKRWDGKWRVLIFDIPEKRKGLRDKVRRTLTAVGFVRLQDSVWLYPYDCEDLIVLLKADFKIGKDLLYLIVDSLENDTAFRKFFGIHMQRN